MVSAHRPRLPKGRLRIQAPVKGKVYVSVFDQLVNRCHVFRWISTIEISSSIVIVLRIPYKLWSIITHAQPDIMTKFTIFQWYTTPHEINIFTFILCNIHTHTHTGFYRFVCYYICKGRIKYKLANFFLHVNPWLYL